MKRDQAVDDRQDEEDTGRRNWAEFHGTISGQNARDRCSCSKEQEPPWTHPGTALKCASLRSAVKSSFTTDQRIGAPRPGAGEGEIEENEAVERRQLAAVQQRIESLAGMRHEIGGRGEAREDEGDRPREQAAAEQ